MFFPIEKIAKQLGELKLAIHRQTVPLTSWKFRETPVAEESKPRFDAAERVDFDDRDWRNFTVGDQWGGYDVLAWFRTTITVPRHLRSKKLALRCLLGPRDNGNSTAEGLLYINGEPLQAFDAWHDEAWLPPELLGDGTLHVAIKAWSGVLDLPQHRHFRLALLVWLDEPTERLYFLADTLLGAVQQLEPGDLRRIELLRIVDHAIGMVEWVPHRSEYFYVEQQRGTTGGDEPAAFAGQRAEQFYGSIARAATWLEEQVRRLGRRDELAPTVIGIGHAHIDLAWLWRVWHAREKAVRTFTTALHLMRQYPEYCFLHSSPQLYQALEREYPALFDRVKRMVRAGRWEVSGGMWVEPDTNIPNGESLVRQILLGKRYCRATFGVDTAVLWLPDVFGFCWSLPQLMRRSGLRYLMTTKISWNQYNRFPHDTFVWRGIDGSEVLAHFVTTPEQGKPHLTYNGQLTPFEVKGMWERYQQKELNDELIQIYGWGDGGGGPTKEMLESAKALRRLPGMPRVELGKAEPFFERLGERLRGRDVPVWDGELYLEFHRGTYTSQAATKRANRRAEVLYHQAEWLSAAAAVLAQAPYPQAELHQGWELLLFNQFHDILPGSSIRQVYQDSRADYDRIAAIGNRAVQAAEQAIAASIAVDGDSVVVYNGLGWRVGGLIELPYDARLAGKTIAIAAPAAPAQLVERDGRQYTLLRVEDVPAYGYRAYRLVDGAATAGASELLVQAQRIENRFWRLELNAAGQISSLWDKRAGREVLAGAGNLLQAFQDKPMAFDAWDIDIFYREKMQQIDQLADVSVVEAGPLRGVLRLRWRFNDSTISQLLTVYADSPRIDFRTEVDWHEQQVLLKVAFPIAVRSTKATYDIQWGNIERPTHWNTSWDWARFENVAQKWVDLGEGDYGVALLNDCKYGYDVRDNLLRLTLIKSPVRPDPQADQGRHVFTYSLLPHAGTWRDGNVVREAYELNYPLHAVLAAPQPGGRLERAWSFAALDAEHVIIETIKRAEDDDAWIVRAYEYKQQRSSRVTITFGRPMARAYECDLLENAEQAATIDGAQLRFAIAPYEIKSFKVWLEV